MNDTTDRETEVIIIGGGPVGMGLAIELGQRQIHCILVERYELPQRVPKGQNLTQRTMEHFHFWGVENEVRKARTIPPEYGISGLTAYGTLLGQYHYDWLQRELVRPFYFRDNERLPQYATEAALRRRVSALPTVETFYGWSAEEVTQTDQGANVVIKQRDGADLLTLESSYVVGCDGSRSITRTQAGITQAFSDHDKLMVLLVFRSAALHQLLERLPGKSYFNVLHPDLKGYWKFFGRVDLGTTWFFHAPVPAGTTSSNFDFRQYLNDAVGAPFDIEFEHIGFWDLRFAMADTYRSGRIFIAGDAAHSHPPYGGYGVNTGFEDARNLGWKLAAALQGWAGYKLLDSYDEERRPVFQSTARDFIEKAIQEDRSFLAEFDPKRERDAFEREWKLRQSGARSEVAAFEPHYEGSSIVFGRPGSKCSALGAHVFKAQAGHHLAPQLLSSGHNVFEELGEGLTLLGLDAREGLLNAFERAARALRIPLKVITDSRKDGREHYDAASMLIRPDQFVAWASDDALINATEVLQTVIGASD